eukprot:scaffold5075_cov72-Phaeocystis_antarctica.AAC.1
MISSSEIAPPPLTCSRRAAPRSATCTCTCHTAGGAVYCHTAGGAAYCVSTPTGLLLATY